MQRRLLVAIILTGIIGVLLMDKGITGMAIIGQSCCFGPTCPADNLCDAAEAVSPQGNVSAHFNFLLGAVLLLVGIYTFAWASSIRDPTHRHS